MLVHRKLQTSPQVVPLNHPYPRLVLHACIPCAAVSFDCAIGTTAWGSRALVAFVGQVTVHRRIGLSSGNLFKAVRRLWCARTFLLHAAQDEPDHCCIAQRPTVAVLHLTLQRAELQDNITQPLTYRAYKSCRGADVVFQILPSDTSETLLSVRYRTHDMILAPYANVPKWAFGQGDVVRPDCSELKALPFSPLAQDPGLIR